jgi:hypothetical protein
MTSADVFTVAADPAGAVVGWVTDNDILDAAGSVGSGGL